MISVSKGKKDEKSKTITRIRNGKKDEETITRVRKGKKDELSLEYKPVAC